MSKSGKRKGKRKFISNMIVTFVVIIVIAFIFYGPRFFEDSQKVDVVANGSLYYSEIAEGYVIRTETVLQGQNYKNGMVQIVPDGEKAAKNERVFRYYSNSEKEMVKKISELDEQINDIIENSGTLLTNSDIASLDDQIEKDVTELYRLNDIKKIQENKNKIEAYIYRKAQLIAELSPSDSYVKVLTEQRKQLEQELANSSENIYSPSSGLISYRVDGLENVLKTDNFDYLSKELLESFDLKVGASTPQSTECGKIVDNFADYIAISTNTERAMTAEVGDVVEIEFSNSKKYSAEIVYVKNEEKSRIIVFKLDRFIAELLEYRKISFDIIWWSYKGWKVSNQAIVEVDDQTYVEKNIAGFIEQIPIKVIRQNDTYSIIENYEEEELKSLGYSDDEIKNIGEVKLYDEILLH